MAMMTTPEVCGCCPTANYVHTERVSSSGTGSPEVRPASVTPACSATDLAVGEKLPPTRYGAKDLRPAIEPRQGPSSPGCTPFFLQATPHVRSW